MRTKLLLTLCTVLAFNGGASATSFHPYTNRRYVDFNGHFYVAVKRTNDLTRPSGPVTITIAEQKPGSNPVDSACLKVHYSSIYDRRPDVGIREGDIVHGQIELDGPPGHILISSSGRWILTLGKYGGDVRGTDALVVYTKSGQVLHRKDRNQLFDEKTRADFIFGNGYVHWLDSGWIDEQRGELVIVGINSRDTAASPIRVVNLTTGEVTSGGHELIIRVINERIRGGLTHALRLAAAYRLQNVSKDSLRGIVEDKSIRLYDRVQAASLLPPGDRHAADLIRKTALEKVEAGDLEAKRLAVKLLPENTDH